MGATLLGLAFSFGWETSAGVVLLFLAAESLLGAWLHHGDIPAHARHRAIVLPLASLLPLLFAAVLTYRACSPVDHLTLRGGTHTSLLQLFRASDGTAYQVVSANGTIRPGVDALRITSVAATIGGLRENEGEALSAEPTTWALVGVTPGDATLFPYTQISRTGILRPPDLSQHFDPTGSGRLRLGSSEDAIAICADDRLCAEAPIRAKLLPLNAQGLGVPRACHALGATTGPNDGFVNLNTLGFGLTATGDPPVCIGQPTTSTKVCSSPSADGFGITRGRAVVFVYRNVGGDPLTVGAAGFLVATHGESSRGCEPLSIVAPWAESTAEVIPSSETRTSKTPPLAGWYSW